jgi:hypothetical protein
VPGVAQRDAKRLGELVVKNLVGELSSLQSGKVATLKVKVETKQTASLEEMAAKIAGTICRSLS